MVGCLASQVEHERLAARPGARNAGRELVVLRAFVVGEEQVVVLDIAFEHTRQAGAANTLFARGRHHETMGGQHLDDGLMLLDGEAGAGACDLDVKSPVGRRVGRWSRKVFAVSSK